MTVAAATDLIQIRVNVQFEGSSVPEAVHGFRQHNADEWGKFHFDVGVPTSGGTALASEGSGTDWLFAYILPAVKAKLGELADAYDFGYEGPPPPAGAQGAQLRPVRGASVSALRRRHFMHALEHDLTPWAVEFYRTRTSDSDPAWQKEDLAEFEFENRKDNVLQDTHSTFNRDDPSNDSELPPASNPPVLSDWARRGPGFWHADGWQITCDLELRGDERPFYVGPSAAHPLHEVGSPDGPAHRHA